MAGYRPLSPASASSRSTGLPEGMEDPYDSVSQGHFPHMRTGELPDDATRGHFPSSSSYSIQQPSEHFYDPWAGSSSRSSGPALIPHSEITCPDSPFLSQTRRRASSTRSSQIISTVSKLWPGRILKSRDTEPESVPYMSDDFDESSWNESEERGEPLYGQEWIEPEINTGSPQRRQTYTDTVQATAKEESELFQSWGSYRVDCPLDAPLAKRAFSRVRTSLRNVIRFYCCCCCCEHDTVP